MAKTEKKTTKKKENSEKRELSKEQAKAKSEAGRRLKAEIIKTKAKIFEWEKDNYNHLFLFRSTNGWWKFGGNSALIYGGIYGKQLGLRSKVLPDKDHYSTFSDGVVSIRDKTALIKNLKELKIYANLEYENYIVFDLRETIKPEALNTIRHAEEMRRKKLNTIIKPKLVYPKMKVRIDAIIKTLYEHYGKASIIDRSFIYDELIREAKELHAAYLTMSRGLITQKKGCERMLVTINSMMNALDIAEACNIMGLRVCLNCATNLQFINETIMDNLRMVDR